jgi:hypothetical protein
VVVKYLAGPAAPADPDDPRSLAVGEPEARSGIFHFQRFGQLGIEVSNEMENGMLNRVTFIPWGAVLSIRGTTEQERAGGGGRLTREQVAELAQRDNIRGWRRPHQAHWEVTLGSPYSPKCLAEVFSEVRERQL